MSPSKSTDATSFTHLAAIAAWMLAIACLPALGAVMIYDSTAGTQFGVGAATETNHYAERFTPSVRGHANEISGYFGGTGTIFVAIHENNGGLPGALLSSGSASVNGDQWYHISISPVVALDDGTQYWYVMSAPAGNTVSNFHTSITPSTWAYSSNGGASWSLMGGYKWLFSVEGTAINTAPVAADDSYTTAEDSQLSVVNGDNLLANDTDAEGDPLVVVLISDVSHGVLSLNADGTFSYVPGQDFNGSDSFTYTASDGALSSNTATVTINISPVNDPPSFTAGTDISRRNDGSETISAWANGMSAGPADEIGQSMQFVVSVLNGASLFEVAPAIDASGTLSYRPVEGKHGTALLEVTLVDDGGAAMGGDDSSPAASVVITVGKPRASKDEPEFCSSSSGGVPSWPAVAALATAGLLWRRQRKSVV